MADQLDSFWALQNGDGTDPTFGTKIALLQHFSNNQFKSVDAAYYSELPDLSNGTHTFDDGHLYFIKTASTGSGKIELHRLSDNADYKLKFDLHTGSVFAAGEAVNGTFHVNGGDLHFIKTRNTGSGVVEVHSAKGTDSWAYHGSTPFTLDDASNGQFIVRNKDIYFIKTRNTTSGKVELYISHQATKYKDKVQNVTVLTPDAKDKLWHVDGKGNLYRLQAPGEYSNEKMAVQIAFSGQKKYAIYWTYPLTWTGYDFAKFPGWMFGLPAAGEEGTLPQ